MQLIKAIIGAIFVFCGVFFALLFVTDKVYESRSDAWLIGGVIVSFVVALVAALFSFLANLR